jgi:Saxitoxin biosynthesis operon protein SxtJ
MSWVEHKQPKGDAIIGSNRSFGLVCFVLFLIVGLWPLMGHGSVRWWAIAIAAVFLVMLLAMPKMLEPSNRVATKAGRLLGSLFALTSLGLLFCLVLVPIGVGIRLFGRDPLKLNWDSDADSYWVHRTPPGPARDSLTDPF